MLLATQSGFNPTVKPNLQPYCSCVSSTGTPDFTFTGKNKNYTDISTLT